MPRAAIPVRMQKLHTALNALLHKDSIAPNNACDLLVKGKLALIFADPHIHDLRYNDKKGYTVIQRLRFKLISVLKLEMRLLQTSDFSADTVEGMARAIADQFRDTTGKLTYKYR